MDLILRNARAIGAENALADIGIAGGRIAAIEAGLAAEGATIDLGGRLVSPGFVETHIHLDKSCILDRVKSDKGDLDEAIAEAAKAKRAFTPEDVHARASARSRRRSCRAPPTCARMSKSTPGWACAGSKASCR